MSALATFGAVDPLGAATGGPADHTLPVRAGRNLALLAGLLVAGCGSSIEGDIRDRFAEKYDRPLCVEFSTPFPATAELGYGGELERWLVALAEGGMLSAREVRKSGALPLGLSGRRIEFSLTEAGRKAITPENHFCYGRAEIVEVIDYTQPADVNGVATVQAEARLRRRIDADWAKHPAVAELAAAGDDTVSMLLVKKAKGGWSPAY
jgi:hypothetical protein